MDNTTAQVLKLDLANLSEEDKAWLHKLKNLATVMQVRLQMKHTRAEAKEAK